MKGFVLSVPASLLLTGEYFVLLEGGLGLAAAIELRAFAEVRPRSEQGLLIHGAVGSRTLLWRSDFPDEDRFLALLIDPLLRDAGLSSAPPLEIRIDTTRFYDPSGVKLGFGSSAATAVLLTAALFAFAAGGPVEPAELLRPAAAAHRRAQGGRGSGYDVAVSLSGGIGIFHGGAFPVWEPLPSRAGVAAVALRSGPGPVSSREAIERFEEFRAAEPELSAALRDRSNAIAAGFRSCSRLPEAMPLLESARKLGIELGDLVATAAGYSEDGMQELDPGEFWKAAGAGNETFFSPVAEKSPDAYAIAEEGLIYG